MTSLAGSAQSGARLRSANGTRKTTITEKEDELNVVGRGEVETYVLPLLPALFNRSISAHSTTREIESGKRTKFAMCFVQLIDQKSDSLRIVVHSSIIHNLSPS